MGGGWDGARGLGDGDKRKGGDMTVWYVLYCVYLYDTGCCNTLFIGVGEDDGMISGGDDVLMLNVVGGMRREISRTKNRMRLFLAGEFCG